MVAASAGTAAADPVGIGTFGRWMAFVSGTGSERVCYLGGTPQRSEGRYQRRGEVIFYVSYRPAEGPGDEISFAAGYPYRPGSEARVTIDGKRFRLVTEGETAWAASADQDQQIVTAFRSGRVMIVNGTSSRGTPTTDTFDLEGSSAAYWAMRNACS